MRELTRGRRVRGGCSHRLIEREERGAMSSLTLGCRKKVLVLYGETTVARALQDILSLSFL